MVPEKSLPPSLKANCKDDARSKRQPMNLSTRRGIDARARSLRPVSPPVYVARLPRLHSRYGASFFQIESASRIKVLIVIFTLRRELDLFVPGFRIFEDFTFIIPDNDLLVIVIKNVAGIDRHFASASRRIDDELRHGITGGVTTQAFNDLNAFRDRSTQMRRTVDEVALINVIRTHPA